MVVFDCVDLRDKMEQDIKAYIDMCVTLDIGRPTLRVITVGRDYASNSYVKSKEMACRRTGVVYQHIDLNEYTTADWLDRKISEANSSNIANGVIVQFPIDSNRPIPVERVLDQIDPIKDVDGLSFHNMGKLAIPNSEPYFIPCTAKGVVDILTKHEDLEMSLQGKHVVIIGKGLTSGRPLSLLLPRYGATVSTIDSKTPYSVRMNLLKSADIVISCTGNPSSFIPKEIDLNKEVILINVGMSRHNGKLCGDIDIDDLETFQEVIGQELRVKVNTVTKSTGILTVTNLLYNTCLAHLYQEVPKEHFNTFAKILDRLM